MNWTIKTRKELGHEYGWDAVCRGCYLDECKPDCYLLQKWVPLEEIQKTLQYLQKEFHHSKEMIADLESFVKVDTPCKEELFSLGYYKGKQEILGRIVIVNEKRKEEGLGRR